MLTPNSLSWSRVTLLFLLIAVSMIVACDSGNIVIAGTVYGSKSEPLCSRLVVVFLNDQEVGRDATHYVEQGTGRRLCAYRTEIPNAWNFSDQEFGPEGQKEILTLGIYREYPLAEGVTKSIKLSNHNAVFSIKVFMGEVNLLPAEIRKSPRLVLLRNDDVAPSTEPVVEGKTPDYFSRAMLAIAGFLITFTLAAYALPSIIPKRKTGTAKRRQSKNPSLEDLFIESTPLREFVILGIATAFSLIFASWLFSNSAAEDLIRQLTDQYYSITSLFIGILALAMAIPLLRKKITLNKRKKKLDDDKSNKDNASSKKEGQQ